MNDVGVLPNLIIAGANKCGTTSLFHLLSKDPEISKSKKKETCYFLPLVYGQNIGSIKEYKKFFSYQQNAKIYFEATPGYLYGGEKVAKAIDELVPEVKILIVLRDPVQRFYSFYNFKKAMLELDENIDTLTYFNKCKEHQDKAFENKYTKYFGVEGGKYAHYLKGWLEIFGGRIKIIFFEDLIHNTDESIDDICLWLGLGENRFKKPVIFPHENKTRMPKMKLFHDAAVKINKNFESFFRKHHAIKVFLRSTYYHLFGCAQKSVSLDIEDILRSEYKSSNLELKQLLKDHDYEKLPMWLDKA